MRNHWHEQIQRYVDGRASVEEIAELEAAMKRDADLRALYLDYMNLDAALAAAAEMATIPRDESGRIATFPRLPPRRSPRPWRWLAAAAACAALILVAMLLFRDRHRPRQHPEIDAACTSTKEAIARLSVDMPPSFPEWASPTTSMFDQPHFAKGDL